MDVDSILDGLFKHIQTNVVVLKHKNVFELQEQIWTKTHEFQDIKMCGPVSITYNPDEEEYVAMLTFYNRRNIGC